MPYVFRTLRSVLPWLNLMSCIQGLQKHIHDKYIFVAHRWSNQYAHDQILRQQDNSALLQLILNPLHVNPALAIAAYVNAHLYQSQGHSLLPLLLRYRRSLHFLIHPQHRQLMRQISHQSHIRVQLALIA